MKLCVLDLEWVLGPTDDPADQCAHGSVLFQIDDTVFLQPEDGRWTVSAAGLFLLRTLENDHTDTNPVSERNFLFPHCGHAAWLIEDGRFEVLCQGCDTGVNPEVIHTDGAVLIRGEQEQVVSFQEWKDSVFAFADQVREFYDKCSQKVLPDEGIDREGWAGFWQEWHSRREATYP
jgi:hypothetical protein